MDVQRISTKNMTRDQWVGQRHNGIGGSDVSSVLGLNPYKTSAELFYEKVLKINPVEENQAMHWGEALEDIIADRWCYWDGDPDSMIRNYNTSNPVRFCKRVNAILKNMDYPWLLANLDRAIIGSIPGVLEIKTVSGWAANQWNDGIPPYYLIQLQTYLLVTGYQYGEIAILRDGRFLDVIPFNREDTIIDKIIERTKTFWDNVLTARELLTPFTTGAEIKSFLDFVNIDLPKDLKTALSELEPAPDDSVAYEEYLKKRYRIEPVTKQGTADQLAMAMMYLNHGTIIKDYEKKQREISNTLKHEMAEAECLDFGSAGRILHRENVKGAKTFMIKIRGGEKNE